MMNEEELLEERTINLLTLFIRSLRWEFKGKCKAAVEGPFNQHMSSVRRIYVKQRRLDF